jgi:hypothetical protein
VAGKGITGSSSDDDAIPDARRAHPDDRRIQRGSDQQGTGSFRDWANVAGYKIDRLIG